MAAKVKKTTKASVKKTTTQVSTTPVPSTMHHHINPLSVALLVVVGIGLLYVLASGM